MKSYIDPVCRILESNRPGSQSSIDVISQFISTCEIDPQVLYTFSIDPQFSTLVRHLTVEAVVNMKESTGIKSVSDLASSILQFLSTLSTKHPILHEIITSNTNLDDIITAFYNNYILKSDIRSINAPLIFPYIKFISILASSPRVNIIEPQNLNIIFTITSSLLENPQLSAWAAAIIAGLARNCPAAEAYLKTMPNLLQVKRDLSQLFSSNDICIVCASLSATVALFPIGTDAISALRASTHFLASDSQFQLLLPLASMAIIDLVKKSKLTEEELTTILMTAITAKSYNAFTLFHLLSDLTEYHPIIANIIKTTEYMETLFVSLLSHEEEYVAESGCHFLLCLSDCDSNLFSGLNQTDLFATILASLLEIPATDSGYRSEPFIVLLRLILKSGPPKKTDVSLLTQNEDAIFTSFLRHIENNDSYLSIEFFLFIQSCSKYIKGWNLRMKRIVIDSVFPVLVVNVLNESENRHATEDSLYALNYFCSCKEPEFFNLFVSAYVLLVSKSRENKKKCEEERDKLLVALKDIKIEKQRSDGQIEDLNQIISQQNQELTKSRKNNTDSNANNQTQINPIQNDSTKDVKAEINLLKEKNEELNFKYHKQKKLSQKLREENIQLLKKLEYSLENDSVPQNVDINQNDKQEVITKIVTNYSSRNFTDEENKDKIASMQKTIFEDSQKISRLESDLRIQKGTNEKLMKEMEQLQNELNKERDHSNQLQSDIEQVEKQNLQYRSVQKDINHVKRKYEAKKTSLVQKLAELEKEKGKWESLAKFYGKLCQSKGDAVKEVYHVFS